MPDHRGNEIVLIAAVAENRAMGRDGRLPWRLRTDLKHFQRTTLGYACIMGRRSFEERNEPLRDRRNIVLTRQAGYERPGIEVASSLDEAIGLAAGEPGPTFVLGGAGVFADALGFGDRFERTLVHAEPEADVFFPEFDESEWALEERSRHEAGERDDHPFTIQTLRRL